MPGQPETAVEVHVERHERFARCIWPPDLHERIPRNHAWYVPTRRRKRDQLVVIVDRERGSRIVAQPIKKGDAGERIALTTEHRVERHAGGELLPRFIVNLSRAPPASALPHHTSI